MSEVYSKQTTMPKVRFIGQVLPRSLEISVHVPELTWEWSQAGINLVFATEIEKSVVTVDCTLPEYKTEYVPELYRRAVDVAKTAANIIAFTGGVGLIVHLDTFIDPSGNATQPCSQYPELIPICTSYSLESSRRADFDAVAKSVFKEWPLFRALDELIASVYNAHVAPVNCGRVIEGIRRMIIPPDQKGGAKAWHAMHHALNIDSSYQIWISDRARGPRHADPTVVVYEAETIETIKRTWEIMNRFLEYRKRGNKPLTAPEFPLLS